VPKLFLPQYKLEEWVVSETADLRDGKLFITGENSSHPVEPAVHFTQVVSGTDGDKLLDKVKTHPQLAAMGAELLMNSVLVGECAYEVTSGYIADVSVPGMSRAHTEELLAAFLLETLP
jgi:hypothetical protein